MSAGSFTGNLHILEKGSQARFLVSKLGRFGQPDGVVQDLFDPQALNRFAYVANNPLNLIDVTGNSWSCTGFVNCREWFNDALKNLKNSGETGRQIVEVFEEYIKSIDVTFSFSSGGGEDGCIAGVKGSDTVIWECFDYVATVPASAWTLAVIAHELIHLLDHNSGGHVFGEVDAYYAQYHVLKDLGYDISGNPDTSWMIDFVEYIDERGGLENLSDEDLEYLKGEIHTYCSHCGYQDNPLRPEGEYSMSVRYPGPKQDEPRVPITPPAKEYERL